MAQGIQQIEIAFDDIKDQSIGGLYHESKSSILEITINDGAYNDTYKIKVQNTNLGLNGLCFLNGYPSYQADFQNGYGLSLRDVVNNIAGGYII